MSDKDGYFNRELLRFTTAGSVDDGKSTLIGRLLYDSKAIFQDQMEQLERTSRLRGEGSVNLALLTDGLRAEREQGITIDVAYRYFSTPRRKFIIADTPGHEQYTRNMVTGASTADLAIILIDARNGVLTQSKRHGFIASLLGIPHVMVAVNKMDIVDWSEEVFNEIVAEYMAFSEKLDIHDIVFVPISALTGDNVVNPSENMRWYDGSTVLHYLENVTIAADRNLIDFRFPVQYVIRPHQDFRGFAGRISSGTVSVGEEVLVLPSRRTSRVKQITSFEGELEEAFEAQSVVLSLTEEIDISRGDMIVRSHNVPWLGTSFDAILCWMDDESSLRVSHRYILQHTTREVSAFVTDLRYAIDVNTLHRQDAETLSLNEIGRISVQTSKPIFFDAYRSNRETGSFILVDPDTNLTVAAGMIRSESRETISVRNANAATEAQSPNVEWDISSITREQREARNGHRACVIWFTGLSGSGKSTISKLVEQRLFEQGAQVVRLDGDNVRHGLSGDLGFSTEDRSENIRRVGHAANLFFEHGAIVLCSFISPMAKDRALVRSLFPTGSFIEVYAKVDIETAKDRDPKGLYRRAERGEIPEFTGIDSPYEAPENADIVFDTAGGDPREEADRLIEELVSRGVLPDGFTR
jgi:bifunctional enzyme CysN/CysC